MNITRSGDSPSAAAPADHFTGQVRIDAPEEIAVAASYLLGPTPASSPAATF